MKQGILFNDLPAQEDSNVKGIGARLFLKFTKENPDKVSLYYRDIPIKIVDLSDRVAKRLLVVELVEMGATKTRLAAALQISRQSIHNYTETKKHFGLEGLINNYSPSVSESLRQQRENHVSHCKTGNKARWLEKMRKEKKAATSGTRGADLRRRDWADSAGGSTLCRRTRMAANPLRRSISLFSPLNQPKSMATTGHGVLRK